MRYTVFKPNPKNSGGLVNFHLSKLKDKKSGDWKSALFAEFVPQKGWNDDKKVGSFDPEKKRFVLINVGEAGEILHTMKTGIPFQNYHDSGDRSCWVKFASYETTRKFGRKEDKGYREDKVVNFAIGVSEKGNNVNVPLTPGEAEAIRLLLESYIKESMAIDAKEHDKKFKKTQEKKSDDSVEDTEEQEEEEDDVVEEDDSDIPF